MNKLKWVTIAITMFILSMNSVMAQSTYTFIGSFKSLNTSDNAVTVQAQNGAVKLEYFQDVGFRVRYSFSGKFDKVFSYATVDPMPGRDKLSVDEENERILVTHGNLTAVVHKNPVRLEFRTEDGFTYFKETLGAGHHDGKITEVTNSPKNANYYGLGEKASALNRTGRHFEFWNTDTPGYEMNQDPLYQTYPFYIGLVNKKAFGVYYDNSFHSSFDFSARLDGNVTFASDGGELRFYVFYGPQASDVLKKYTTLTGRTQLPPKWGLGYQQSRWGYYPADEFRRMAYEFRSRHIPCDVLYSDIDYMRGYRVFTWDKSLFPHPQKLLSDLQDKGFKTVVIIDPGVKKDSSYFMYQEGVKNDYFVKLPNGDNYIGRVWPGKTAFPDFSNPDTRDWWSSKYKINMDQGIDGFWNDMDEPSSFGGKTIPNYTVFNKDGHKASALEMHNQYGLLMARSAFEGMKKADPNKRPFIITRAAFSGVQRYSSVWTGDNSAKWDDVYLTMPMIMGLGVSGVPYAGFDIGGFNGSPSGEMYMRFLQIGAFMPFSRSHTVLNSDRQEPWSYGQKYEYINRKLIEYRYQLIPHLYTAFFEHTQDGEPIIRPLFWEYQDDPKTYNIDTQFFFGDNVMVAPVIHQGKNERSLYLPKGNWFRITGDRKEYSGGQNITVPAPINSIDVYDKEYDTPLSGVPVFARGGSVVPMQEVQQYVGQKDIDTAQLHIFTDGSGSSKLYEDSGKGYDYRDGAYRLTRFQTKDLKSEFTVNIQQEGHYSGAYKTFACTVYGLKSKPESVTVDGKNVDYHYNPDKATVTFQAQSDISNIDIKK